MEDNNKETFFGKYSKRMVTIAVVMFVWSTLLNIIELALVSEGAKIAIGQLEDSTSAFMLHRAINYGGIIQKVISAICFIITAIIAKPIVFSFFHKPEDK